MGCWGMGVTQSDEYCEIYERFMEEYDEGKPLSDIKTDILDEYLEEFDENDGVLHDVYFAIGKAEWMCGGISTDIFEKVSDIIKTDKNIDFYRELEATESDLKQRKKNLDKFLDSLSVPRGKTKKRRIPTEKYKKIEIKKLPDFQPGDIFAYEVDGKYRLLCFVSRTKFVGSGINASFCYAWAELFEQIPLMEALTDEYLIPLGYFTAENFPDMEKLRFVENFSGMTKLGVDFIKAFYRRWATATYSLAKEENLIEEYPLDLCAKYTDCIKILEEQNATT